jgi:hypothetical protein
MKRIASLLLLTTLLPLSAVADPSPGPQNSAQKPAPVATFPATSGPTPIPCASLANLAGVGGKPVSADTLGALLTAALKHEGLKDGTPDKAIVQHALIDVNNCFG